MFTNLQSGQSSVGKLVSAPLGITYSDSKAEGVESSEVSFAHTSDSSCWLLAGSSAGAGTSNMWPLHVAWASSQHGGWVPRMSVPREGEPGGSYVTFCNLALEVMQHLPLYSVHCSSHKRPSKSKGRRTRVHLFWEQAVSTNLPPCFKTTK